MSEDTTIPVEYVTIRMKGRDVIRLPVVRERDDMLTTIDPGAVARLQAMIEAEEKTPVTTLEMTVFPGPATREDVMYGLQRIMTFLGQGTGPLDSAVGQIPPRGDGGVRRGYTFRIEAEAEAERHE